MIGPRRFKRVWEVQGFDAEGALVFYSAEPDYVRLRQARRVALAITRFPVVQRVRVIDVETGRVA